MEQQHKSHQSREAPGNCTNKCAFIALRNCFWLTTEVKRFMDNVWGTFMSLRSQDFNDFCDAITQVFDHK